MSLVGTRPPTVDEWEKYELHHRSRMSTKPGITGMWQVSGRSDITDFEEVVRLDTEYIEHWTIGLDIKILIKTVLAVVKHEGYTYDLARLLVDMNETEKFGYYHATNEGGYISWYDFTKEIYRQAGYKTEVKPFYTILQLISDNRVFHWRTGA